MVATSSPPGAGARTPVGVGVSEGQAWRLDLSRVLQAVQVLKDPRDLGSLDPLRDAVGTRQDQGLERLVEFDTDRVVETP
jgi:hypothetical protein